LQRFDSIDFRAWIDALFLPQRLCRIDPEHAPRGEGAGDHRDEAEPAATKRSVAGSSGETPKSTPRINWPAT
jgi:hypothetical protein